MKIYTKTGDTGETGLLGGVRVSKAHIRVDAYGHVDELVSYLGLIHSLAEDEALCDLLANIQLELFLLNTELATPEGKKAKGETITEAEISALEQDIDRCDEELPALRSFILPGGAPLASHLHVARTICRRAERALVLLVQSETVRPLLIQYLNRLSDLLFSLGRLANTRAGVEEIKISDLRQKRLQRHQASS